MVDEPGVLGWATVPPSPPSGRLFVRPGTRPDRLAALLDHHAPLEVSLLGEGGPDGGAAAARLLGRRPELAGPETATAMLLASLTELPDLPLPGGLTAQPVTDGPDGVPLAAAAAACRAADEATRAGLGQEELVAHLRRIADAVVLAAVDPAGRVQATAGTSGPGEDATVFLVSTAPAWRGRGVALSLTARVLRTAAERGAVRACLDASAAGRGAYARLGFATLGTLRSWRRRQGPLASERRATGPR